MGLEREPTKNETIPFTGVIRPLEQRDLSAIRPILERWVVIPDTNLTAFEEVETYLGYMKDYTHGKGQRQYVVAETQGQTVGVIGFKRPSDALLKYTKTPRPTELVNVYVSESIQGTGAGSALLSAVESILWTSGTTEIILRSTKRNKANGGWGFYEKNGFNRQNPDDPSVAIYRREI